MPIQLGSFDEYRNLPGIAHGLSWICCNPTCKAVNRPSNVVCSICDKQRWEQLGVSFPDAMALSKLINAKVGDAHS